jgi:mono/diheme cytochrome c family protein
MAKAAVKLLMIIGVIGLSASARAAEIGSGKAAYQSNCAPCHGMDGKGGGLLNVELGSKLSPPDLTILARRNNGEFPTKSVSEIIEATSIAADSTRQMPLLGFDVAIRSNIPAIVDYLKRIQQK